MTLLGALTLIASSCTSDTGGSDDGTPSSDPASFGSAIIRISEIHYHAPRGDDASEFLELTNIGEASTSLLGWCIKGVKYCVETDITLAPGEFLTLPQSDLVGRLANDSDTLTLVDAEEQTVDEVSYTDSSPWPEEADGGGLSLQRVDFAMSGSDPVAWTAAFPTPSEPYEATASATPPWDVVVSEIHYHPADDNPAAAFIELTNTTDQTIDVGNWCIDGAAFCMPNPSLVPAGGALALIGVFTADTLSHSGDRLRVVSPDGIVHDSVRYEDHGNWPALADGSGLSLHRRSGQIPGTEAGNWEPGEPTPGVAALSASAAVLPTFSDLTWTQSPAPDQPVVVTAKAHDADAVRLAYVTDFGAETTIDATLDVDGEVSATIPSQPAGTLIRFRLLASAQTDATVEGTWPRSGDGARYEGTVVTDPTAEATQLPRLQWFMPSDLYKEAYGNTALQGDDGYPAVLAFGGAVIDNVTVRVKGNQARTNRKRKWKMMLPPGHEWDADGLLPVPIDQFDLLPAATDPSFSREVLVADMQALSGGISQGVLPMRVELNNDFYGLYLYGESPDGGWRERAGLSADTYVWKVDKVTKLRLSDLSVSSADFAKKFERITNTYLDDNDVLLRDFVTQLNTLSGEALVRYAYEHLDIPQIVEALATMRIVQHSEWQHKNYYVMFDPSDGRWRMVPIDFDLTFGRRFQGGCGAMCPDISASPYTEYPGENSLAAVLLENEPFRSMVDRRTRSLADDYLAPGRLEQRLAELLGWMEPDSLADNIKWPPVIDESMAVAQQRIIDEFLVPKRNFYLGTDRYLPLAQPAAPALHIESVVTDVDGRVVSARVVNGESIAIDISHREFAEIGGVLPAGVVVSAGGGITVVFDRAPVVPGGPLELTVVASRTEVD